MLKIGITGGIGSGKSLVCDIFRNLGIPVFNADLAAKHLMNNASDIKQKITVTFGASIYRKDNTLDRKKLASIIFNDQIALEKINAIVHPAVRDYFETWAQQQKTAYVIQEAAILFETGQIEQFDKIILVTAPLELKIERVMQRDNISRELVVERIKNQLPDNEKTSRSDFVILNDGQQMLLPQILNIHTKLL
ncbi:MAG TPA: dephospho-CoA kinase [Prolixibacteraceae bacterium]|nr:dephospho-CoA kinase [Prolixibacteraceae bacterium]